MDTLVVDLERNIKLLGTPERAQVGQLGVAWMPCHMAAMYAEVALVTKLDPGPCAGAAGRDAVCTAGRLAVRQRHHPAHLQCSASGARLHPPRKGLADC